LPQLEISTTKARKDDKSHLNNWILFFQARTEEDFEMLAQTSPAIAEAWGVIKVLSGDERERAIAEAREKGRMDMLSYGSSERRAGMKEGRQEGKLEVARNLLQMNMSFEDIAKATQLSLDEVSRLSASLTS
jgi:predicted transposase/invertase (TIGR01784 family)